MKWSKTKLGDSATFINGYAFKPSDWKKKGLPIIRIQDLTGNNYETNYYDGNLSDKYKIENEDLLISWSASLGVYEWNHGPAWLNQHIFKVVFDKLEWDKKFFKFLISFYLSEMKKQVHGATMKHITKSKFDNIIIPYPDIDIQRNIASILDEADSLRKSDAQLVLKYEELLKASFLHLFGDPVLNDMNWNVGELGSLSEKIQIGPFGSQLHSEDYIEGGIPLINPTNIIKRRIVPDNKLTISKEKFKSLPNYHLKSGDIIMGRRGEMGRCALITEEENNWFCGTGSLFIRPKKLLNSFFLLHVLSTDSFKLNLEKQAKGITMPNLNLSIVSKLKIPLPPISIQKKFEEVVVSLQDQKLILEMQQDRSENLFKSLMQKAFRGGL